MSVLVMGRSVMVECTMNVVPKPELHGGQVGQAQGVLRSRRRFEETPERGGADQAELLEATLHEETPERAALFFDEDSLHVAPELGLVATLADHGGQRRTHRP